jgi:hypothetical protein
MAGSAPYDAVLALKERGLMLLDWAETELSALVTLDEDRAWPAVEDFLSSANDFKTRHLIAKLTPERKRATIRKWIERGRSITGMQTISSNSYWKQDLRKPTATNCSTDRGACKGVPLETRGQGWISQENSNRAESER